MISNEACLFACSRNRRRPVKDMAMASTLPNIQANEKSFWSSMKNGSYKDKGGTEGGRGRKDWRDKERQRETH